MGCKALQLNQCFRFISENATPNGFRFVGDDRAESVFAREPRGYKSIEEGFNTYDLVGNRLKKVHTSVSSVSSVTTYTYNPNDQLTLESNTVKGDTQYTYDANGSLIGKVNQQQQESYLYTYNLQNRLASANIARMEPDPIGGPSKLVEITSSYLYNQSGIRVASNTSTKIDGGAPEVKNTVYLTDPANFTGYAQVLEETVNGTLTKSYTLGDDILSQTTTDHSSLSTAHLLYDGHGSTRLLTSDSAAITARYNYDAYGKNLFSANIISPSATNMLYSGEQFDPNLQMQYLRARYYDQSNGRFNRLDSFGGNNQDPQSLHKYAYTHCNPVMGIDPHGMMTLANLMTTISVIAWLNVTLLSAINLGNFASAASKYEPTEGRLFDAFYITFGAEFGWKLKGGITGGIGFSYTLAYIRSLHKWFGFSSAGGFSGSFSRGISFSIGVGFNIHKPSDFAGVTLSSNIGLSQMHPIVFPDGKGAITTSIVNAKNWLIAGNSGILSGVGAVGEKTLAGKAVGGSLWTSGYFTGGKTTFGLGLFYSPLSAIKLGKGGSTTSVGYSHSVTNTWRQDTALTQFFNERLNPHTIHIESSNFIEEVLKAANGL